ncbi:MAG: hypothetical protein U5J62_08900 [Desulfurivibrio sp.]|nr:hypothetical protein [Desulfurivibrio sp.]
MKLVLGEHQGHLLRLSPGSASTAPWPNLSLSGSQPTHFHDLDVWGYHLVNVSIHCLAGCFSRSFHLSDPPFAHFPGPLRRPGRFHRRPLAATLWATSPIQVTAVTYLVQRMTSMAALFLDHGHVLRPAGPATSPSWQSGLGLGRRFAP